MSESEETVKYRVLRRTENAIQRQSKANEELRRQGQSLKQSHRNINELRDERRLADRDLTNMKHNRNVFKRFFLDNCCCCCCQWCRQLCEDKRTKSRLKETTTESEEPDPDDQTVNATWTLRYRHMTVDQQIAENLRRLNEDAEETERELRKQNQLVDEMEQKAKRETQMLNKSSMKMKQLVD